MNLDWLTQYVVTVVILIIVTVAAMDFMSAQVRKRLD